MKLYHWAAHSSDTRKVLKAEKLNELMKTDAMHKIAVLKHLKIKMGFLLAGRYREVQRVTDECWG